MITVKHYEEEERIVIIQDGVKQAQCNAYELNVIFEDLNSLLMSEFGADQDILKYVEIESMTTREEGS